MPTISEEMKKKIQTAVKAKENKTKRGVKKEIITEDVGFVTRFHKYPVIFLFKIGKG